MSWSISVKGSRHDIEGAIRDASPMGNDDCIKERNEQVEVAKDAAVMIALDESLSSFSFGDEFVVNMSGHANPDHKDRDGWSPDSITVHVTRVVPLVAKPVVEAAVVVEAEAVDDKPKGVEA